MAKLTRYTNFKRLKQDVESDDKALNNNQESISELEEFLNLLRSKLVIKKKKVNSKITDGEQTDR